MNMNYEQRRQKLLEDKSGPCMVLIFPAEHRCVLQMKVILSR